MADYFSLGAANRRCSSAMSSLRETRTVFARKGHRKHGRFSLVAHYPMVAVPYTEHPGFPFGVVCVQR